MKSKTVQAIGLLASATVVFGGLAACASPSAEGESSDFTVGVVALDSTQITANRERAAAMEAMTERGWETFEINSNGNPAEAITAMQNMVQRGVDAIVVQTYTPDQISTGLAAADAAGIPVFGSAGGAAEDGMAGAVELVNEAAVNDVMIEELKKHDDVELLQLRYTPGSPCRTRADDLDAKLEDLPHVAVTRQEVTIPGGQQSAQEATTGWLQGRQNSTAELVIWPCFSEAALGAIAAEQQQNRGPYSLFTWDVSEPAIEQLQSGRITALLWIQVEQSGIALADLIEEYRESDGDWETKTVSAPAVLLTPDNIEEQLAEFPDLGK